MYIQYLFAIYLGNSLALELREARLQVGVFVLLDNGRLDLDLALVERYLRGRGLKRSHVRKNEVLQASRVRKIHQRIALDSAHPS